MTAHDLDVLSLSTGKTTNNESDEEFSIPIDISDIITICREFNKLGYQIQNQVETILELGVEESIKSGNVKRESLPHIKNFLQQVTRNVYFGDAVTQADDCINLIKNYENSNSFDSKFN